MDLCTLGTQDGLLVRGLTPRILCAKLLSKKIPEACDPVVKCREPYIQRKMASGHWLSIERAPLHLVPLSMEARPLGNPGPKNGVHSPTAHGF